MVRQLSAILRLAVALDRRNKGAVAKVECNYNSSNRTLDFQLQPAEVGDRCSLELWNLSYKKEAFEEEFNVELIPTVAKNQLPADRFYKTSIR